jgi:hypothetical protein
VDAAAVADDEIGHRADQVLLRVDRFAASRPA